MIVRRCEELDLPMVLQMAATFHAESPVFAPLPFDEGTVYRLVRQAISDDNWLALVAVASGGELVGIGLFYAMPTFFGPAIEAGDLAFYVTPSRRGGLAAAGMLEAYLRWAGEKGASMINMGVNTGINHDVAIRTFAKAGFRPKGTLLYRSV